MNQLHLLLKYSAFGLVSGSCYVKQQSSAIKAMICSYDFFWYDYIALTAIDHFTNQNVNWPSTSQRQKPNGLTLGSGTYSAQYICILDQ